jgi:hypothetical protein
MIVKKQILQLKAFFTGIFLPERGNIYQEPSVNLILIMIANQNQFCADKKNDKIYIVHPCGSYNSYTAFCEISG